MIRSSTAASRFGATIAFLVLWLGVNLPAQAQVFKCTDERGKLSFSDKPCADGGGEVLSKYTDAPTTAVSGTAQRNEITQNYVDGLAYWRESGSELVVVLMRRALEASEIEAIENGDLSMIQQWRELGIAEVTFLFNAGEPTRTSLRHMRSVFTGFDADNALLPWTSNHEQRDLRRRITKFEIVRDGVSRPWLRAKTNETSEFISWELAYTVRILR